MQQSENKHQPIDEAKASENESVKYRDHLEELVKERTAELEKANEVLQLQAQKRKNIEETIRNIAEGVSAATGDTFFRLLVQHLVKTLNSDYAFVGELINGGKEKIRTLALCSHGKIVDNIEYDLANTPCENAFEKDVCSYPRDVQIQFPEDHLLKEMDVESYVGTPLFDSDGNSLGIAAVLDSKPLINPKLAELMMQIFATRASVELQRKRTEQALRESEARYKAVIDNAQEGIVVVQDKMLKFVNPKVTSIMDYTEEELTSRPFIEFVHPEDRDYVMKIHLKRFKMEEVPEVYEFRVFDKQNNIIWLESNGILIDWSGGPATLNFLRDITERKKTEEELKKKSIEYKRAQEIGKIGSFTVDIINGEQKWSDEIFHILGLEPGGVHPSFEIFTEYVHPEDKELLIQKSRDTFAGKADLDHQYRIIRKDGEVRFIHTQANLEKNKDGTPLRIYGFSQDITERQKAEDELKENEERFRSLSNAAFEGIVITKDGRFVDVNVAFTSLFGYEPDEIKGTEVHILVPPEDQEFVRKNIQSGYEKPYEHKALRKDGSVLDVEVCGKTVLIKGQECRITAVRDITERKKAEEKLLDYQAKLQSLASQLSITEESERRRIATELHDQIGQSLVFSKIKLDELHQTATSSELAEALDEICNNIDQVIQDTRTLTFDLSSPILNELGFEAAISEWLDVQIREQHGIETEFVDDEQQKPLDDDIRALLFRNVRELLVNVIKHADAHKVKVSVSRVNEHIQIDVEDDGKGFDPVKVMSTGIEDTKFGLFSIRQRLEQLGGYIEFESEKHGSKITMTAPLKLSKSKRNL